MTSPPPHNGDRNHVTSVQTMRRRLHEFTLRFNAELNAMLVPEEEVPPHLIEAVRYSATAPGKRIRPYLAVRCCELAGGCAADAWPAAAAVECIHTFSLIHDDLPAMDDDDVRRGRPACHKQYDEATAILAGDALLTLAFELLARDVNDSARSARMILELARGTGWTGMIGGQAADMVDQSKPPTLRRVEYIHQRKTARLFESACRLGALAGGAQEESIEDLGRFGQMLGRAFQIADDLLDVTATEATLGKRVGKDAAAGKQTYPHCMGMEQSRTAARAAMEAALCRLDRFGADADDLRTLADYILKRDY